MPQPPRQLCFVAIPFGRKPFEKGGKKIDFDQIYKAIRRGVQQAQIECQRADFEPSGGFIHRSMFEALIVAEFVVADLTLANPNVTYEIGVRHGVEQRNTLLVCAERFIKKIAFDFGPLRTFSYKLDDDLKFTEAAAEDLTTKVRDQLKLFSAGKLPDDNPILQVTGFSRHVSHEKADMFVKRLEYAGSVGEEVRKALILKDSEAAVARLEELQDNLLQTPNVVHQLHSALMAIYLGFREKKAYRKMLDLYAQLPRELQNATVALEQLALAYNRLAEAAEKKGQKDKAAELWAEALHTADMISENDITSETYGILGRIHKAQYDAFVDTGEKLKADAALAKAIETYEKGLLADPRDYYPGVNAVTLRVIRGTTDDEKRLERIVPVVRFAVERTQEPKDDYENYWRIATQFELACAERDWKAARKHLISLLPINVQPWMRETTMSNLELQKRARSREKDTIKNLDEYLTELKPK
jgi:tetratricopeptide (TPR) repeat protein